MSENYMVGTSLADRQMYFYNGYRCPYCFGYADYVDSIEVYQESHGMIYICRPCKAWVGVHSNSDQALGCLAKKPLRDLRHEAHKWFDPLWQAKKRLTGCTVKTARGNAYTWVAKLLNIDTVEAHIGYFNDDQCKMLIEECKNVYKEIEKKNEMAKFRTECVLYLAGEIGFEVTKFEMNGLLQLELVNHNHSKFIYHPKVNEGKWAKDKKFKPIEDIEKFIYANFK